MSELGKSKTIVNILKVETISHSNKTKPRKQIKLEFDKDSRSDRSSDFDYSNSMPGTSKNTTSVLKSPKGKSIKLNSIDDDLREFEPPAYWVELIENMKTMRLANPAPVDSMGCDSCHDKDAPENVRRDFKFNEIPKYNQKFSSFQVQRFQKLVALMLSSQTKDQVTYAACQRLKEFGFTPEKILAANTNALQEVIKPVAFYKTKAKYLQRTAKILIEEYDSDIPETLDGLLSLPGVGGKMAHLCMRSAWDISTGIGVDTHVHRISNRFKFVNDTKTPEGTRYDLESWLPKEYWHEINTLMVGFGQTICTPLRPKCHECISNNICPSAFKVASPQKKRK